MAEFKLEIIKAIKSGNKHFIPELFGKDWNWHVLELNDEGAISIHLLAKYGQFDFLSALINEDYTLVNKGDYKNQTALHYAAREGLDSIIALLLSCNADVTKKTYSDNGVGKTALDYAQEGAHDNCAKLIEAAILRAVIKNNDLRFIQTHLMQINFTVFTRLYEIPVIYYAIIKNRLALITLLIDQYPQLVNEILEGITPLYQAIYFNRPEILQLLIDRGADINISWGKKKLTPLALAREKNHSECIEILQKAHLHLVQKNINSVSDIKLIWKKACFQGLYYVAEYLLKYKPLPTFDMEHPIHWAALYGHLDIVTLLIKTDNTLLDLEAINGFKPIHYSLDDHQEQVFEFLLDKTLELDVDESTWKFLYHKADPNSRIKNLLLLKKIGKNVSQLLPFLSSSEQIIDLMDLEPTLIKELLAEPLIINFLRTSSQGLHETQMEYYYSQRENPPPLGSKRSSFYAIIDKQKHTLLLHQPAKNLGTGAHGSARLFKSKTGETVAVKSLTKTSKDSSTYLKLKKEKEISTALEPQGRFRLFQCYDDKKEGNSPRFVMPYIKGVPLKKAFQKANTEEELAEIILKTVQKVISLHKVGFIHCDLSSSNILVHSKASLKIGLIDFGFSYSIQNGPNFMFPNRRRYPPELYFKNKNLPLNSSPSQDVYILAYTLNEIFESLPLAQKLFESFPCIQNFIKNGLNPIPEKRPKLEDFEQLLTEYLNAYRSRNLYSV
jgi:ankyrin repeat protein/predicted Ser/Thr protein kinase